MSTRRQAANSLWWQMFRAQPDDSENLIFNVHHFLFVILGSGKGKRLCVLRFTWQHSLPFNSCLCRRCLLSQQEHDTELEISVNVLDLKITGVLLGPLGIP